MIPSVGRIVHLRLSEECAKQINKRRADAQVSGGADRNNGAIVHTGNPVAEGDVYPLLITRVWAEPGAATESTCINGQVFLDGNDTLWASSAQQGDGPGLWFEPPRV
jgi:hypothetical protein